MKRGAVIFMLIMSFLPLVSIFTYFLIQSILDNRTDKEIYLDMRKELHYSFKIDTIYRDKDNRMVLTMKGKEKEDYATSPSMWDNGIFEVGDSIVKKKDSLQIYIYRCNNLYKILDYNDIEMRE